jgi:hypothetical protein
MEQLGQPAPVREEVAPEDRGDLLRESHVFQRKQARKKKADDGTLKV